MYRKDLMSKDGAMSSTAVHEALTRRQKANTIYSSMLAGKVVNINV
jgi:hypothetical protein